MKRFAILLLLSAASAGRAASVITENLTIRDGNAYGPIEVRDGAGGQTTVRMEGGSVEDILALDSSRVEVSGGFSVDLTLRDQSSALLRGGELTIVGLSDNASLEMSGGRVFLVFAVNDRGSARVTDGIIQASVGLGGNGKLEIDGGQWDSLLHANEDSTITLRSLQGEGSVGLWASDRARVKLFASDTRFDPISLALTGSWLSGGSFTIHLHDSQTFDHVTILPEPGTLLLFAVAALAVSRRHPTRG